MVLPVEVKILDARLHEWGLPSYQSEMAAAIDLSACVDKPTMLEPQAPAVLISSGIAISIGDRGITALIVPRSGLGHYKGLVLGNAVGVIDPDYTGPIMMSAWNRNPPGSTGILIHPGERIAQMLFVPIVRPRFAVVTEFSKDTARGGRGFGSSGV